MPVVVQRPRPLPPLHSLWLFLSHAIYAAPRAFAPCALVSIFFPSSSPGLGLTLQVLFRSCNHLPRRPSHHPSENDNIAWLYSLLQVSPQQLFYNLKLVQGFVCLDQECMQGFCLLLFTIPKPLLGTQLARGRHCINTYWLNLYMRQSVQKGQNKCFSQKVTAKLKSIHPSESWSHYF